MNDLSGPPGATLSELAFRLFVESVVDYAIFILDPRGVIVSWNKGAARAKGYTADEIIGKHFSIFYTPEDIARNHPEYELRVATQTGRYEEQGWRVRKDGTRFWANVVITAVRDEQGTMIGFGKVTRDMTEQRESAERELRLERQRATAEASSRAKTDFLRTMSHELRTPLNAITGYLDLLEAGVYGELTPEQKDAIGRVRRSSRVLLGLINDVLNIARIEAGQIEYRIESVSVKSLLEELEHMMAAQFLTAGIDLTFVNAPDLVIRADYEKSQQILLNLLGNSLKFTPSGGRVSVSAAREGSIVAITVDDTGRGIPPDKQLTIFDRFVQIDRHLTENSQRGVGLGLSISRELARGMQGDITVKSEPGKGATFRVTLPAI
jgi:PAS domain S-box-containing protein